MGDGEEVPEIENYFILRLPKAEAKKVHKYLRRRPKRIKKRFSIELDDRIENGIVKVANKFLPAKMVYLPAIIDVNKTTNQVTLFKTGTICQMLIADTASNPTLDNIKNDNWPHGVSLPLKNVRKQRFRRTIRNQENSKKSTNVQKEVCWLLRSDSQALSSRFEITYESEEFGSEFNDDLDDDYEYTVEDLFGDLSDSEVGE